MKVPSNIGRSTLLATAFFWTMNLCYEFHPEMIPFMILSIVPIAICCTLTILVTICPFFFFFTNTDTTNRQTFETYFPYYSIVMCCLCMYGVISSGFNAIIINFFVTAYLTTCQSWLWFAKE